MLTWPGFPGQHQQLARPHSRWRRPAALPLITFRFRRACLLLPWASFTTKELFAREAASPARVGHYVAVGH